MTCQELMERAFRDGGEPSDLCPYTTPGDETTFDITLPQSVKLLRLLNTAILRIANWRFRDGHVLRLRSLRGRLFFQNQAAPAGTAVSATDTTITIPGLSTDVADEFNGWLIQILTGTGAGQTALVIDTVISGTDVVLTLDQAWATNPDSTSTYELYKNFFLLRTNPTAVWETYHIALDPTLRLADILKIRDVTGSTDLSKPLNTDMFTGSLKSTGIPSVWQSYGNEVWFDVAPTEARSYEILYMKNPALLTLAADVPELPEIYHEPVALWLTHNIMRQNQDFDGAYATKRELEDQMEMTRLQGSFDMEIENGGLEIFG